MKHLTLIPICGIYLIFCTFIFTACGPTKAPLPDSRRNSTAPTPAVTKQPPLEVIGSYKVQSGWLFVYKLNNDTIYIMEGQTSASPVSLQIK